MKVTFKIDDIETVAVKSTTGEIVKTVNPEQKNSKLTINIEFDSYDPKNESLRNMVFESIKKNVKQLVCAINDEMFKAKKQEDKLRKEIEEQKKAKEKSEAKQTEEKK